MAALDKMNEFYSCARRFAFLARCYRADNLPPEINQALDSLCVFIENNKEFNERIDEAEEAIDSGNKFLEIKHRAELLSLIVKECCR